MPKLFINRRSAAEHRADPTQDPDAKRSIFNQVSGVCFLGMFNERSGDPATASKANLAMVQLLATPFFW